jgi:membrane protein implicated in regulation of membrane protease activity
MAGLKCDLKSVGTAYTRGKPALRFDVDEGGWLPLTRFLVAWANAPYTVALGIVGLFALLSASGLLGLLAGGEHGGGDDGDGADVDGHDVEGHEADHDGGHDDGDDHDADQENDADRSGLSRVTSVALGPLGIGKLPFSLVWQVYGAVFALTGLGVNAKYIDLGHVPPLSSLAWTMPLALGAGYGVVAAIARVLGPALASKDVEATSRAELVGHVGTVISTQVDADFGEIRVRDKTGHDLRIVCRLAPGHSPAREKQEIVVVDHDRDTGTLFVALLDEGLEEQREEEEEGRKNVRG